MYEVVKLTVQKGVSGRGVTKVSKHRKEQVARASLAKAKENDPSGVYELWYTAPSAPIVKSVEGLDGLELLSHILSGD